ncbi:histidine phosphatase family protein [Paenibacillus sp. J5C_2022]|uniref:histidine phosphatase family protein n=1 Tax=Paenibacillus sp. J5C2022 TaxID=2977129 RepID=UPI0021D3AFC0|nr:histidine phosphatase family protein [Paenibacillus sp. J5C2022]MCU6713048.1 histidine phosphatase family protein [Paenibacillus sp. J5C2022]
MSKQGDETVKNIFFIRHCQAEGQDPSAQLTEEGTRQSYLLAEFLKRYQIDQIITSPFLRAIESIKPLCKEINLDYSIDNRLEERNLSSIDLENWMDFLKESYDDLDVAHEGGESSRQAMSRGLEVINEIIKGPNHNVILVTHGALLSLILKYFDNDVGFEEWKSLTNPDIYLLRIEKNEYTIERIWK